MKNLLLRQNKAKALRFFILPVSILYMELIVRLACCERFFGIGLIFVLLYSIVLGLFITFLCSWGSEKANRRAVIIVQTALSVWYCTQIIYHSFFGKFLILYSLRAGGTEQIIGSGLAENTLDAILGGWWAFLLLAVPVVLICVYTKYFAFQKIYWKRNLIAVGSVVAGYLVLVGVGYLIPGMAEVQKGAFNTVLNVQSFGLLRTELLDFRCNVLGLGGNGKIEETSSGAVQEAPVRQAEANVTDIDFKALAQTEENKTLATLDEYFAGVTPTNKNEYTGKFKGYNLIQITAEGFSPYAIDKDLTPTLYKMQQEGFRFTNFYTPIWEVSTSDGEYAATTGLIPKSGVWSYYRAGLDKVLLPYTMPQQFLNDGVETVRGYHNHTYTYYHRDVSHTNLGLLYKGVGNGLEDVITNCWPESDWEMINGTVDEYIGQQRFMTYYMTASGHLEYSFDDNSMAEKNQSYVANLAYSDTVCAYLACNIELDRAMEALLDKLEKAGVADRTVIAITPDHYPYGLEDKESENIYHYFDELAGHSIDTTFELYKSVFLLYCPGMEQPVTVDKYCSSLDIIPTLNNLFGFEYDSRLLAGQDILSDSSALVIFLDRSWITDKGKYNATDKTFTLFEGQSVADEEAYVESVKKIVSNKFNVSAQILETDYYALVTGRVHLYSKE